jgi:hypothetical protein
LEEVVGRLIGTDAVFAEFGRVAAARRYESLRYRCTNRDHLAPTDVPRRIFEEFYARDGHTGQVAFEDRLVEVLNSGALSLMISVGYRTGLFIKALGHQLTRGLRNLRALGRRRRGWGSCGLSSLFCWP